MPRARKQNPPRESGLGGRIASGPLSTSDPDPEAVRRRAYERFLSRHGNGGGTPEQDWLEAEAELRREYHLRVSPRNLADDAALGRAPDGA